jgi:hypothetical protein
MYFYNFTLARHNFYSFFGLFITNSNYNTVIPQTYDLMCSQKWVVSRVHYKRGTYRVTFLELKALTHFQYFNPYYIIILLFLLQNQEVKGKIVNVLNLLSIMPWRHMGEWRYGSTILDLSTRWMNGQLPIRAALLPGKWPPVHTG